MSKGAKDQVDGTRQCLDRRAGETEHANSSGDIEIRRSATGVFDEAFRRATFWESIGGSRAARLSPCTTRR